MEKVSRKSYRVSPLAGPNADRGEGLEDSDFTCAGVVDATGRRSGETILRADGDGERLGEGEMPTAERPRGEAVGKRRPSGQISKDEGFAGCRKIGT